MWHVWSLIPLSAGRKREGEGGGWGTHRMWHVWSLMPLSAGRGLGCLCSGMMTIVGAPRVVLGFW